MKVYFQTLGCRLNEAELETWASGFLDRGFELASDAASADLMILNTCSVTGEADRKSRQQIRRLNRDNPRSRLVVTGCYASLQAERVQAELGVDLVIPNPEKDRLVEEVVDTLGLQPDAVTGAESGSSLFARGRHRAFIKVQDGCRYRCTFCIVTVARGEERSRPVDEIVEEVNRLHQAGVQEVVITGVHVGGYGSDTGSSLYRLLNELLERTEIPRIRLASVEPWDLPDGFFHLFEDPRLMPHMHLPLQSGSDTVLRRMARRCKTAEFERLVDRARTEIPLFNVTTDLIVGFPGETEQEWQQTLRFVERVGFGHMHVFAFSPRNGTKAARLPDPVPESVKKTRSREMHELAQVLKQQELRKHLGTKPQVLWEKCSERGVWSGYTPHFHRIESSDGRLRASSIRAVVADRLNAAGDRLLACDPFVVPGSQDSSVSPR